MTWQNDLRRNIIDLQRIGAELKRGNREIHEDLKVLDGWANRVMRRFNIDPYAEYPKRTKHGTF